MDNGRCFHAIRWPDNLSWLEFQFRDGSTYTLEGPISDGLAKLFTTRFDPGCAWNAVGPFRTSSSFHKGRTRQPMTQSAIWRATPLSYIPFLEVPGQSYDNNP